MGINKIALHNACNASIKTLRAKGKFTQCTPTAGYTLIDNGSSVLGVAHIDTVQSSRKFQVFKKTIQSPRLDDRLGVYTLLDLLPSMGIKLDVLLCEDEEIGQSTAQYFTTEKEYNWIVEFDRGGDDVVQYQFETNESIELLESYGFTVGYGSYTDICELDELGIMAFNVGVGYEKPHSLYAFMRIKEYESQIQKFVEFYLQNKDTRIAFDLEDSIAYKPIYHYQSILQRCPLCDGPVWSLTHLKLYGMCINCADELDRLEKKYGETYLLMPPQSQN